MVDCWLPYGETEIYVSVDMDQLLGIAEPTNINPEKPPQQIIVEALQEPSGGKTLDMYTSPDSRVAISIEGTTPSNIATLTLSTLVNQLVEMIVPRDRITIIIANGIRTNSDPSLIQSIRSQKDLMELRLLEHNRNTRDLIEVGSTKKGTIVSLNKAYREASLKIAVGTTNVDHYTGFSGAYSAVVPGISGQDTVLSCRKYFFRGKSAPGVIELNPVKEEVLEAVKLGGIDFAVNLVMNYNDQLLDAQAGSFEESWGKSITGLRGSYEVEVKGNADIAIVSAGGHRYDRSFYSAVWAIDNASKIIKKNGSIILLAECVDGLGAEAFTSLARVEELNEFERRYSLGADALQMVKKLLRNNRIILVTAMPRYLVEPLGIEVFRTANEAYNMVVSSRRGRKTMVIPYGCSTIPKIS
jgi:nickel-dependent lactate racemase